jgi:WD40 repeat protein
MLTPDDLKNKYEPKQLQETKADRQIGAARISPCGRFLLAASYDATFRRFEIAEAELKELAPLRGYNGWATALAFAPRRDAAAGLPGVVFTADSWGQLCARPFEADDPQPLWRHEQAHDGWLRDIAVSADGARLATAGRDGFVRLWSADKGERLREIACGDDVYAVAFDHESKTLISGDVRGVVKRWNPDTGDLVRQYDASPLYKLDRIQDIGGLCRLAVDPAGPTLIAAGMTPKNGATIQGTPTILLFDLETGELKRTITRGGPPDGHVVDLHAHADGFLIAVTSGSPGNGRVFLQRPGDDEPFFETTKLANCHALAVHPDGRRFIVTATNRGSNGNGRRIVDGEYPGNHSPIHLFAMPAADG